MCRCEKDESMEGRRIGRLALVAAASLVAGCAAESPMLEQLMVVPGYYDTLSCREAVAKLRSSTERVRELILLMEKSGGDATGAIVNAVAYDTEYANARSTQKHAEEAAVRKRCDLGAEPSKQAPRPAAVKSPPRSNPPIEPPPPVARAEAATPAP